MSGIVIVGAGHAAGQCAASLRQEKYEGAITIIGDEPHVPYQRPPLSKQYLSGEQGIERVYLRPEKFYADNCVMQENTEEPTVGKDANRQREIDFFDSLAEFHGGEVRASAIGDGVTFSEWLFDVTFKDGPRKKLEQAVVRRWEDGKIVHERFYYNA